MLPVVTLLIEKGLPLLADTIMVITKNSGVNMATDYLKRKLGGSVEVNTEDPEELKKIADLIDKHKDRLDILEEDLCDMDELIGLHREQCMSIDDDLQDLKQRVDEHEDKHVEILNKVEETKKITKQHEPEHEVVEDVFIRRFVPIFSIILFVVAILLIVGIIWIPTSNPKIEALSSSVIEFAKNIIIMISSYYLGSSQSSQNKMDTIRKMKMPDTR